MEPPHTTDGHEQFARLAGRPVGGELSGEVASRMQVAPDGPRRHPNLVGRSWRER